MEEIPSIAKNRSLTIMISRGRVSTVSGSS